MGKKKGGSEPVTAPPALPPSSLPAAESSELVHGEAVLPPGFEEAVPFDQLFLRNKRVSFHPLFRSAESSVTALGGVLTYSETKAWQQYGETAGFVAANSMPQPEFLMRRLGMWGAACEEQTHSVDKV